MVQRPGFGHITLTNHFLLLTLGKWAKIAEQRAARGDSIPEGESDLQRLEVVGQRGSFAWVRPEHMEPTGDPNTEEVRETMGHQFARCLEILQRLDGGIGALCQIRMTVNNLGKIDLYQWMCFLAQHARRHLQQMEAIETEFKPTRYG